MMAMNILKNRVAGTSRVIEIHLDIDKMILETSHQESMLEGPILKPDPEWVAKFQWGADVDPDQAMLESMRLIEAQLAPVVTLVGDDEGEEFDLASKVEQAKERLKKKGMG